MSQPEDAIPTVPVMISDRNDSKDSNEGSLTNELPNESSTPQKRKSQRPWTKRLPEPRGGADIEILTGHRTEPFRGSPHDFYSLEDLLRARSVLDRALVSGGASGASTSEGVSHHDPPGDDD
jgi:hypothetical protein